MNRLDIELAGDLSAFSPGQPIRGTARWRLDIAPEEIQVRLFWYTEGKGDQDVEIVDTVARSSPAAEGELEFSFTAPAAPLSFSGRLISLVWAVEAVVLPGGGAARHEILLARDGREIRLDAAAPEG